MDIRKGLVLLLLVLGLGQGLQAWQLRAVQPPDGTLAPAEPQQTDLEASEPFSAGHWQLRPRARYDITARILSREDYHFDAIADLVPEDLALGWGPMSDNQVLRGFEITQDYRFFFWRSRGELSIPREVVIAHAANTHVIPADRFVRAQLKRLRVGQVVHLSGLLVDGQRDDGRSLRTSMTRTDSGPGACEIMWVEAVETL